MLGSDEQALLDGCPVAALIVDAAGRIVFANLSARQTIRLNSPALGRLARTAVARPAAEDEKSHVDIEGLGGSASYRVRVRDHASGNGSSRILWLEPVNAEGSTAHLDEAERRLRYIIEMLPQAVCVFDAEDRYVLWNERYAELYPDIADHLRPGIAFEDILRISLKSGKMPEVVEDDDAWLAARMAKFRGPVAQEEQQLRDGRWLRHDDRRTPDGGAVGIRIDITELKQREEWLRQLFDANPMPMLLCDGSDLTILGANQAAARFFGLTDNELLARRGCDMHVEHQRQAFAERVLGLDGDCDGAIVWQQRIRDGAERHVLVYVRMLKKGAERRFLMTIADVTDRVEAEIEARHLANHDALTGLANRMHFYDVLDKALRSEGESVAVYCLDLDGFKPVNDVFGHATGDEVLKRVAARLSDVASGHVVARVGGDEFAILARGGLVPDLADRIIAACREPFTIQAMTIGIGVSIGIASGHGTNREALLQSADGALYRAKAAGRNTWRLAGERVPDDLGREANAG